MEELVGLGLTKCACPSPTHPLHLVQLLQPAPTAMCDWRQQMAPEHNLSSCRAESCAQHQASLLRLHAVHAASRPPARRQIGVSNFDLATLAELCKVASIKPVCNQVRAPKALARSASCSYQLHRGQTGRAGLV